MSYENTSHDNISEASDIFDCRQCGECCKGYGGTYISPKDIQAISDFIKIPQKNFLSNYCQSSGSKVVIAQAETGYCIFWKDKICTIHPVKPKMCRQWPYIQSVLTDVSNWRAMAGSCPGMRTDVSDDKIALCVNQEIEKRNTRP